MSPVPELIDAQRVAKEGEALIKEVKGLGR
jgi:hypothetical protein